MIRGYKVARGFCYLIEDGNTRYMDECISEAIDRLEIVVNNLMKCGWAINGNLSVTVIRTRTNNDILGVSAVQMMIKK